MTDQDLVWASLEAAAEQCEDLSPGVYAGFFAVYPQAREIFGLAGGQTALPLAMGNMINDLLRLIADGPENDTAFANEMATIAVTHAGNGIFLDMYRALLEAMTGTVRDHAGSAWTAEMAEAWTRRTGRILQALQRAMADLGV